MENAMRGILGVYAVLLIVGGVMGKVQGGSTISLIAGSICGALVLACLGWSLRTPFYGIMAGGCVAFLVGAMFLKRYLDTHKVMPSLVFLIVSLVVALALIGGGLVIHRQHSTPVNLPGASTE